MSIPKNLRTLKTNFEEADGLGIYEEMRYMKEKMYEMHVNFFQNTNELGYPEQFYRLGTIKSRVLTRVTN